MAIASSLDVIKSRAGGPVRVLGIARISTVHQDEQSLDDQEALYRRWLEEHGVARHKLRMLKSRGSGERLDRAELKRARRLIKNNKVDLVLAEDLGRIVRRVHGHIFCELCEDHDTRLVAINDNLDTANENWRSHSIFAAFRHEQYNGDTAKRIRRTLNNRFDQGGVLRTPIFGIEKPPGAKHDSELRKFDWAQPYYDRLLEMLENDASFAEVADWFQANGAPLPPSVRLKSWHASMIQRIVYNPLISGLRVRNQKKSKRVNQTGRYKSVNAAPEELRVRHVPHLAFIEPERYKRLIAKLNARNARFSRRYTSGIDPRLGRPKKRSRWPGQHIYCGICGRMFVYSGGRGQVGHLMCQGARDHKCWNGLTVHETRSRNQLLKAILAEVEQLPDFDAALLASIQAEAESQWRERMAGLVHLRQLLLRLDAQVANVTEAIATMGMSQSLRDKLFALEAERADVQSRLRDTEVPRPAIQLDAGEIRRLARQSMTSLAAESWEFARLMRKLISRIVVYPMGLYDHSTLGLRAEFALELGDFAASGGNLPEVQAELRRQIVVELFERPQRVALRQQVVDLRASGMRQQDVAATLGITATAAQHAAALDRGMKILGLDDPYVLLTVPPTNSRRLRRHLHPRYRFDPLPTVP
ncbi:MAG: recombinase family protein [Pirellulales bacterium]|nr:recombinase family protein [Pirellulales bacterium]